MNKAVATVVHTATEAVLDLCAPGTAVVPKYNRLRWSGYVDMTPYEVGALAYYYTNDASA